MRPPAQLKTGTLTITTPVASASATSEIKSITPESTSSSNGFNNDNSFRITSDSLTDKNYPEQLSKLNDSISVSSFPMQFGINQNITQPNNHLTSNDCSDSVRLRYNRRIDCEQRRINFFKNDLNFSGNYNININNNSSSNNNTATITSTATTTQCSKQNTSVSCDTNCEGCDTPTRPNQTLGKLDSYQIVSDNKCSTVDSTLAVLKNSNRSSDCLATDTKVDISTKKRDSASEQSPLLVVNPDKTITLIKQNSTSVIFTRKDLPPTVHRYKAHKTSSANEAELQQQYNLLLSDKSVIKQNRQKVKSWCVSVASSSTSALGDKDSKNEYKEKLINNNLACTKKASTNGLRESASLLENPHQPKLHQTRSRKQNRPSSLRLYEGSQGQQQLGGPAVPTTTKYNRFEQLLKNLVGRKVSRDAITTNISNITTAAATTTTTITTTSTTTPLNEDLSILNSSTAISPSITEFNSSNNGLMTHSPEIKISKTPSAQNLIKSSDRVLNASGTSSLSTTSLNAVQHKLWSVVPLLRREGSCSSLYQQNTTPLIHQAAVGLKKCETVLALSRQSSGGCNGNGAREPIRPQNRLRNSPSMATCSRCSSILSLAANGSRYSLNLTNGNFIPISSSGSITGIYSNSGVDMSKTSLLPRSSTSSSSSGLANICTCKLCLSDVREDKMTRIMQCGCSFCTECMKAYVEFEISEGAYEISCPDAMCNAQGILTVDNEIASLVSTDLLEKHKRFRLYREVELDKTRAWCPKAGCETVCSVNSTVASGSTSSVQHESVTSTTPVAVKCPTCVEEFCSACKKKWHPMMTCEEYGRQLAANGNDDSIGIPFDTDLIKYCPMCGVPIEKDEGCAQMMCKRCKHVFCWYCLASLDDDFLLRHYDKGPCKNKLGHSRASVVWHRAQVIGIFAGFGILLLVASPLLLLAAPCIVCCKCRICSNSKLEDTENEFDDPNNALNR